MRCGSGSRKAHSANRVCRAEPQPRTSTLGVRERDTLHCSLHSRSYRMCVCTTCPCTNIRSRLGSGEAEVAAGCQLIGCGGFECLVFVICAPSEQAKPPFSFHTRHPRYLPARHRPHHSRPWSAARPDDAWTTAACDPWADPQPLLLCCFAAGFASVSAGESLAEPLYGEGSWFRSLSNVWSARLAIKRSG